MNPTIQAYANLPGWQKATLWILAGAGIAFMLLSTVDDLSRVRDPGLMLAAAAGSCYCFMGAVVGAGLLAPKAGARFLNVANAEEIEDERAKLWSGALSCILVGLFFLALALARSLPVSRTSILAGLTVCIAAVAAMTIFTRHHSDELTKAIGTEASALTLHLTILLYGSWATLAHLGFIAWITPLAFVAGLALLVLVAIFWVLARRGLMSPR